MSSNEGKFEDFLAAPFPRTLRSLREDGFRSTVTWLAVSGVLLAAWGLWFIRGTVRVYERSEVARVEVDGAGQPIQTPVSGRVVASSLVLGAAVRAADVLVELDSRAEMLALEEATRRRDAAGAQVEFLRAELEAVDAATGEERTSSRAELGEARARRREAEARVSLAKEEALRLTGLRDAGHVGEMELLRASSEAETRMATAEASTLDVSRIEWARRTKTSDRIAAIARLRRDLAMLAGEEKTAAATMDRLAHDVERRKLRSPVAGRLGEVVVLREGSVVHEGDRLATVIPPGELRIVAEFAQLTSVGRLRPGQAARVRLTGFNWAEYGSLTASVVRVASEAQGGRVRAELRLDGATPPRIPLQHGLTAVVDVEVERTSPATLVLRAAGRFAGGVEQGPATPSPGSGPPSIGRAP